MRLLFFYLFFSISRSQRRKLAFQWNMNSGIANPLWVCCSRQFYFSKKIMLFPIFHGYFLVFFRSLVINGAIYLAWTFIIFFSQKLLGKSHVRFSESVSLCDAGKRRRADLGAPPIRRSDVLRRSSKDHPSYRSWENKGKTGPERATHLTLTQFCVRPTKNKVRRTRGTARAVRSIRGGTIAISIAVTRSETASGVVNNIAIIAHLSRATTSWWLNKKKSVSGKNARLRSFRIIKLLTTLWIN